MTASGVGHLASLWFRELSAAALLDALWGSCYLFIAIGLFGLSRFTLFIATVVSAVGVWLILAPSQPLGLIDLTQVTSHFIVATLCASLLYKMRHLPSA